ncbi:TSUP family transporter [Pseudomaricurvus alcaniphilus]|uniref:TSUP family transporter n=1 Tax=Pseudomaricurvus alcaniphilus TaxID=1166482 RepID=UPI001AA00394
MSLNEWLPPELAPGVGLLLLALSAFASMITASIGAGGGVLTIIALSLCLPAAAIIPVHGFIQLGSNGGRCLMTLAEVDRRCLAWFVPGVLLGAGLATVLLVQLPAAVWQLAIALFVLYLCWGPALPPVVTGPRGIVLTSTATSFLTMFVGATGPLVAGFLKHLLRERQRLVATMAAVMVLQHGFKALVFGAAGFNFLPWLGFIGAMIGCGALGTWAGLHLLRKMDNQRFYQVFNILLSVLALRLLWQSMQGFGLV